MVFFCPVYYVLRNTQYTEWHNQSSSAIKKDRDIPTLTFIPLGNADSCLIDLQSGEKLLLDYGNQGNPEDDNDLR